MQRKILLYGVIVAVTLCLIQYANTGRVSPSIGGEVMIIPVLWGAWKGIKVIKRDWKIFCNEFRGKQRCQKKDR